MYHTGVRSTGSRRHARRKRSFMLAPSIPSAGGDDGVQAAAAPRSAATKNRRRAHMRINLMIEVQEGVTWDQWLALALACEEHGLEGLFRSDHYAPIGSPPGTASLDAWATLAALAARAERIRLGTLVSPVTFRHPSVLAKMAATVDHVSGGRVEVGLGAGWYHADHAQYGFPFADTRVRMQMLAEQLEILHRSFKEESFSFKGDHYTLEDCGAQQKRVQR